MRVRTSFPLIALGAMFALGCNDDSAAPTEVPDLLLSEAAPVRTDVAIPPFYGDEFGVPLTPDDDPATLVFKIRNPVGAPIGPFPVIAPDGHHVTLGEYITVGGRASVKCVRSGTHTVLHLSGLLPNGVYTVWNVIPSATAGVAPPAVGSLGTNDGTQNTFHASASGEGQISALTPEGLLSVRGIYPACGLDADGLSAAGPSAAPELHLVGAYHFDNQTYGTVPGPANLFIEQFVFVFVP